MRFLRSLKNRLVVTSRNNVSSQEQSLRKEIMMNDRVRAYGIASEKGRTSLMHSAPLIDDVHLDALRAVISEPSEEQRMVLHAEAAKYNEV